MTPFNSNKRLRNKTAIFGSRGRRPARLHRWRAVRAVTGPRLFPQYRQQSTTASPPSSDRWRQAGPRALPRCAGWSRKRRRAPTSGRRTLPAPYATHSADNGPNCDFAPGKRRADRAARIPLSMYGRKGLTIRAWRTSPRMAMYSWRKVSPNRVVVLRDADGTGKAVVKETFAADLRQPFGIAFYPPGPNPKYVYVANTDSVVRFPYHSGDLKATGASETVVPNLPGGGYHQHWTRNLVFRPDGKKLYVSVGSHGNADEGEEAQRAAISEYNPDGSGFRLYATGIRNPVGLAFNPVDKTLWTAVNERDGLGDDLVPDYATSVKEGGFYGWPNYYIGQNHDPRISENTELKAKTVVPDVLFLSHTAALGIDFYTGRQFPARLQKQRVRGPARLLEPHGALRVQHRPHSD